MSANQFNSTYLLGIPPDKLSSVQAAVQTLRTDLLPYLRELNAGDRSALLKMGPKSTDFVDRTLVHVRANPQMKPGFVDEAVYGQTMADYEVLRDIVNGLSPVFDMSKDSMMILGSQGLGFGLACYAGFQYAARLNQPGAELIVNDLAPRFAGQGKTAKGAARTARTNADPAR